MSTSPPHPESPQEPQRRGRGRPVELDRDAVICAAQELLRTEGADALTMRALAAAASTTPATLYRSFGDKNGVVSAVLDRYAATIPERQLPEEPEARLRAIARSSYEILVDLPWIVEILRRGGHTGSGALWLGHEFMATAQKLGAEPMEAVADYRTIWNLTLGALLTRVEPERLIPAGSALAAKFERAIAVDGLTELEIFSRAPVGTPQATYDSGMETLLSGIFARYRRNREHAQKNDSPNNDN
ncbi:MAG: TetR/AcrR family transcriptional regulator [Mycetocola sp.]